MKTEQTAESMLEDAAAKIAAGFDDIVEEPTDDLVSETEPEEEEGIDQTPDEAFHIEEEDDIDAEEEDFEEDAEIARARKAGWRPKEEFKGNPKDWRDYDEFNAVGDRILTNVKQENAKQKEAIKKLLRAQGTIMKQAHEKALKDLKAQRKEAIEYGDAAVVDALDVELDNVKKQIASVDDEFLAEQEEETASQVEVDEATKAFVEAEKTWFNNKNPDMVRFATAIEEAERRANPQASSVEILKQVKAMVVQRFPDRVPKAAKQRRQIRQPTVESGAGSGGGGKQVLDMADLPDEVRQMAEFFERDCGISKKEYLKELRKGFNS